MLPLLASRSFRNHSAASGGAGGAVFYSADFESDNGGFTGDWVRTTAWSAAGSYSLGSSNQGVQSSTSSCNLSLSLARQAYLEADWYVSSEGGYDKLTIAVNGSNTVNGVSGTNSGHIAMFVPSGSFTIAGSYTKDGSANVGLDTGFIDNIKLTYIPRPYRI